MYSTAVVKATKKTVEALFSMSKEIFEKVLVEEELLGLRQKHFSLKRTSKELNEAAKKKSELEAVIRQMKTNLEKCGFELEKLESIKNPVFHRNNIPRIEELLIEIDILRSKITVKEAELTSFSNDLSRKKKDFYKETVAFQKKKERTEELYPEQRLFQMGIDPQKLVIDRPLEKVKTYSGEEAYQELIPYILEITGKFKLKDLNSEDNLNFSVPSPGKLQCVYDNYFILTVDTETLEFRVAEHDGTNLNLIGTGTSSSWENFSWSVKADQEWLENNLSDMYKLAAFVSKEAAENQKN